MFLAKFDRQWSNQGIGVDLKAFESRPLGWKLMSHREQPHRSGGLSFIDAIIEIGDCAATKQFAPFTGCVPNMQDDIGDRVIYERLTITDNFQVSFINAKNRW